MAIREQLILQLAAAPKLDSETAQPLVTAGYLHPDQTLTELGKAELQGFIDNRREAVYQAVGDSIDDVEAFVKLRDQGLFAQHPAFLLVIRDLIQRGRLLARN